MLQSNKSTVTIESTKGMLISEMATEQLSNLYVLKFELPGLPNTTNASGDRHWSHRRKHRSNWHKAVWVCCLSEGRPKKPLNRAELTLIRCSAVEPDFDGLVSSFKPVIDGLVLAGVIENDTQSNIGQPKYIWEKSKPKEGKIKVIVKEI